MRGIARLGLDLSQFGAPTPKFARLPVQPPDKVLQLGPKLQE
jgi:hypothetical protein